MQKIAQFMKVSPERFAADWEFDAPNPYGELKLPRRGTAGSAGYDFYSPLDFTLAPGEFIKIPTGVRARIDEGWVLTIYPRSGQGFKYRLQLYNSVGVIDNSFCGEEDEWKMPAYALRDTVIRKNDRICQFRIMEKQPPSEFETVEHLKDKSRGGFGSTGKK